MVYKQPSGNYTTVITDIHTKEILRIGTFTNEIAAANIINHYNIQYGNPNLINDAPYMSVMDCNKYRTTNSNENKNRRLINMASLIDKYK